jgi:hypothetical protein
MIESMLCQGRNRRGRVGTPRRIRHVRMDPSSCVRVDIATWMISALRLRFGIGLESESYG